jgi:antitoxin PrlF
MIMNSIFAGAESRHSEDAEDAVTTVPLEEFRRHRKALDAVRGVLPHRRELVGRYGHRDAQQQARHCQTRSPGADACRARPRLADLIGWDCRKIGIGRVTVMGVPAAKIEPEPLVSARVKVRPKAQLTLPEEIRRALHIGEGDEVEFAVHDDGTITVRGYVSIPTDQAWFFTPQWLAGEREADEEIAAGRGTAHESADDMFAHLDALAEDA